MTNWNDEATKEIDNAIQNLRSVLQQYIPDKTSDRDRENIKKIVSERKELAKSLGLEKQLLDIWEEIRFYPNIVQRQDWIERRTFSIDAPTSIKKDKSETIYFEFNNDQYSLSFIKLERSPTTTYYGTDGYDSKHPCELYLRRGNGDLLLAIKVYRVVNEYCSFLQPGEVIGFIPGEWLADYIAEYEKMATIKEVAKKEHDKNRQHEQITQLKDNFGIS